MIREKSFYKTLLRLALPSALQSFLSLLTVMADNIMISRFDPENALAAVSQVNTINTFVLSMLMGVGSGGVVLISQYWGKKDTRAIRPVCGMVCMLSAGLAAIVTVLSLLVPRALLAVTLNPEEGVLTDIAETYLRLVCFSFLPYALSSALVAVLKGVEVVKVTLYASVLSLVTNVGLNYLLIFGKAGLPAMGVQGAALATVCARVAELAVVLVYCFRVQKNVPLRLKNMVTTARWAAKDYLHFGLPVALGDAQWALICLLRGAMIGYVGKTMISAMSITETMCSLATMFSFAMADGACVVIGKSVGAGDYARTRRESNTIQVLFAAIGALMCGIVFLLRYPFISLYGTTGEIAGLAAQLIAVAAVTLLGTTYHAACFRGVNRGAGDCRFVMRVDMICGWLVVLPLTYAAAFVFHWPMPVIFLCTRIDQCFKWVIAFLRLRGNKWICNVTREETPA